MYTEFFRLAFRNIWHRGKRSWLTVIGVLIGITAVVALVSIGQGLQGSIQQEFEELGGDKVFVTPGGASFEQQFSGTDVKLTDDDIAVIERTRGVDRVAGRINGNVRVSYKGDSRFVTVVGITTDSDLVRESLNIEMDQGRYLLDTDSSGVVVGSNTASEIFEDEIVLRTKLRISGSEHRVIGIAESAGNPVVDSGILMQIDTARDLLEKPDSYDAIVAEVRPGFTPAEVEENIADNLRNSRNVEEDEEDFTTRTADDIIRSFQNQFAIVQAVLVGIGAISLIVGGVGIMNTMFTSVTERTREIGVMKAIGASERQILLLFLIESGIVGLAGGVIGVVLGLGLSVVAAEIITQQFGVAISAYVSPELVIGALLFAFTVGAASGGLPAREASKLQPAEALRYGK